MCHCLPCNFFFFENAKIWVVRMMLNREKKGDGLIVKTSFTKKLLADCRSTVGRQITNRLPLLQLPTVSQRRIFVLKTCSKHDPERIVWLEI